MSRNSAIVALLAFRTFAIPADAQSLSFLAPRYIPIRDNCCSVLTEDFNRDGRMDIAVAHGLSGITVLLGYGDGSFERIETAQGLATGVVIAKLIAAADFNSDGIVDLLVGVESQGSERPAVLFGNGNGTFQSPAVFDVGGHLIAAVADFNGDGKPDLLVDLADGFAVRLGNGDGTFQPSGPKSLFRYPAFGPAVVGDFNHDGKADVAWVSVGCCPIANVWLGDGRGGFQDKPNPAYDGWAFFGAAILAVGDLNRDGNLDFVTDTVEGVGVSLGNGDGTFRNGSFYDSVRLFYHRDWVTVADLNGDGIPDVLYGFTVRLGNGDGSLQPPMIFGQWYDTGTVLAVADFNGDGKLDLVGTGGNRTALSVLINSTAGTDSSAAAVSAATHVGPVAPGSIASVFGKGLATTTASATSAPWPTSLGNVRVHVLDQNGVERLAGIVYISPSQINFQVPPDTAVGYAIVNVDNGKTPFIRGARATPVQSSAPGFFTADGTGTGVAAATAVRVQGDSSTPVPVFQCSASGSCTPVPIDLSLAGTVYLSVYGTGFGNGTDAFCFSVRPAADIGMNSVGRDALQQIAIPVIYSGPQREFPGLDQLNVRLPTNLHGRANITCGFRYGGLADFTVYTK
jgi:uncharacterized protein (TIGR03437 family)